MSYATNSYILAGFLLFQAIVCFWLLGQNMRGDKKKANEKGMWLIDKFLLFFGVFFLLLSQYSLFGALAYNVTQSNLAPCENIVVNSTDISSTQTTYEYGDSCVNREVPQTASTYLFVWTSYLVVLFAFFIVTLLWVGFRGMLRW